MDFAKEKSEQSARSQTPTQSKSVFDQLHQNSKEKLKRRLELTMFQRNFELKDCTFSPKISETSKTIVNKMFEVFPEPHQRLYL